MKCVSYTVVDENLASVYNNIEISNKQHLSVQMPVEFTFHIILPSGDVIMGNQKTREPRQQRSIEKRNRILEAGYQLFCEKGYYNTNTAEIAKLAGVSTGIIYSYFKDKRDIFLVIIENYIRSTTAPMYELIETVKQPVNIYEVVKHILYMMIESHTMGKHVHEEMEALAHTDEDVSRLYTQFKDDMSHNILSLMEQINIRPSHANEKIHLIISLAITLIHESVYRRQNHLDYDIMLEETVKIIVFMLTEHICPLH